MDLTLSDSDDDLPLKRKTVTRAAAGGQSGTNVTTSSATTAASTTSSAMTAATATASAVSKPKMNGRSNGKRTLTMIDSRPDSTTENGTRRKSVRVQISQNGKLR